MLFTLEDVRKMEERYRAHLINSLSGVKSANLIGTLSPEGTPNLAIVSSVVHLGSDPAWLGYIARPRTGKHHTVDYIEHHGQFTINHVSTTMIEAAHQTSAAYATDISEFHTTGLTPQHIQDFVAPAVKESIVSIGLSLVEIVPLKNGTSLIIGAVEWIDVHEEARIKTDGHLDLSRLNTAAIIGLDHYTEISSITRMAYAKPHLPPRKLDETQP